MKKLNQSVSPAVKGKPKHQSSKPKQQKQQRILKFNQPQDRLYGGTMKSHGGNGIQKQGGTPTPEQNLLLYEPKTGKPFPKVREYEKYMGQAKKNTFHKKSISQVNPTMAEYIQYANRHGAMTSMGKHKNSVHEKRPNKSVDKGKKKKGKNSTYEDFIQNNPDHTSLSSDQDQYFQKRIPHTANTSPSAVNAQNYYSQRQSKKQMQQRHKQDFSQSQNCSPAMSKTKFYVQSHPKAYQMSQTGKKGTSKYSNQIISNSQIHDKPQKQNTTLSSTGSSKYRMKGSSPQPQSYYDITMKKPKKDSKQNRLNLKLINDYEEKKAFSLVSSINNTQKSLHDPISLRALDQHNIYSHKESPLGIHGEMNDLRYLFQQKKFMKGLNIDNLIIDGGTGAGHSQQPPQKRANSGHSKKNKSSKRSATDTYKKQIAAQYMQKKHGKSYKEYYQNPSMLLKSKKKGGTDKDMKDKYKQNPKDFRRKTNSVEPMTNNEIMGYQKAHHYNIQRQKKGAAGKIPISNLKSNNYVMSQGTKELKKTLKTAKRKGYGMRSVPISEVHSFEKNRSSEEDFQMQSSLDEPSTNEIYNPAKRKKMVSSALDTPITQLSKDTSPHFYKGQQAMNGPHVQLNPVTRPSSSTYKRRTNSGGSRHNESTTSDPNYSQHNRYKSISNSGPNFSNQSKFDYSSHGKDERIHTKSKSKALMEKDPNQQQPKPKKQSMGNNRRRSSDEHFHQKHESKARKPHYYPKQHQQVLTTKQKAFQRKQSQNENNSHKINESADYAKKKRPEAQKKAKEYSPLKGTHAQSFNNPYQIAGDLTPKQTPKRDPVSSYVFEKHLYDTNMDSGKFKQMSPRSKEINTMIRLVKKSFKEYKEPPESTTDFYKIGRMLGKGAFGKVNLGMHKLVRKLVAIKSMNKQYLNDERSRKKVMQEVSIIKRTRHPNVVKLYETFESNKHVLFSMEMCAGGDLLNYVRKRRKLKEGVAKILFKQIIEAIQHINSRQIVHRDIKLDNILLDGYGNVKIGDFGVSKVAGPTETMKEQCGTPAYIAPEILRDRGYSGYGVDVWSAGVVLYSMLYGSVPFKANNMNELHEMIMNAKYTLKDEISEKSRDLLSKILEKDPKKRLSTSEILKHDWFDDIDPSIDIFNEQEKNQIKNEFTYNEARTHQRNADEEEAADCFTELNLDSTQNPLLKNVSSKSIILAPFNSTKSQVSELSIPSDVEVYRKGEKMRFMPRCRDVDRQYEINNNCELDNGVYNKFVYNSPNEDNDEEEKKDKSPPKNRDDLDSLDGSFNKNTTLMSMEEEMDEMKKRKKKKKAVVNREESKSQLDQIRQTIESQNTHRGAVNNYQGFGDDRNDYSQPNEQEGYHFVVEEKYVAMVEKFGYPSEYIRESLDKNKPNYCSAAYYLLGIDQNY